MLVTWKRSAVLAANLLVATLASACATASPSSPEKARAEELTAERIYAALDADPIYYYRHVDVRVDGTVAHLSGYIWSAQALYRAERIAARVPGVTNVIDEMELERAGTRGGGRGGSG
jgi:osmotically-inducible protein OsmY